MEISVGLVRCARAVMPGPHPVLLRKLLRKLPAALLMVSVVWPSAAFAEPGQETAENNAQNNAQSIEEVIVTGTYLGQSTDDLPSPVSVIDQQDLARIGAMDMKDVLHGLTFNSGAIGSTSPPFFGDDSTTGDASVNLRNLGNSSTLILVNGKRLLSSSYDNSGGGYVDIQGLIPTIAIERVEVVKDGASSLYGSDAIAGVVNFITRDDTGTSLQFDYASDYETGEADRCALQPAQRA